MTDIDPTQPAPDAPDAPAGDALPPGTRLGEFEIRGVVGVGGFGIVYLAFDHALHREVAVKEYMPAALAARGAGHAVSVRSSAQAETFALGLRSFVNEARILARFDHPSLVKVHRFWEERGTAYMAMPFYRGRTLKAVRAEMARAPDDAWLRHVLAPLLDALQHLHAEGVFHRDVSPDNVLLVDGDRPVLLDFGAARRVIGDRTQTLTAILKPSYAPIEQYGEGEGGAVRQGPWTDLYALGATLHYAITGQALPPATARVVHDEYAPLAPRAAALGLSPALARAVDWMLAVRPADRPADVAALRALLGLAEAVPRSAPPRTTPPPTAAPDAGPASGPAAHATTVAMDRTVVQARREATPEAGAAASVSAADAVSAALAAPAVPVAATAPASASAARGRPLDMLLIGLGVAVLLVVALGWWVRAMSRPAASVAAPLPAASVVVSPAPAAVPQAASASAPASPTAAATAPPTTPTPAPAPQPAPPSTGATRTPPPRPAARDADDTSARPASPKSAPATAGTATGGANAAEEAGPRDRCGGRVFLALHRCMTRECRRPEMRLHPQCVQWRQEERERAPQRPSG